MSKKDYYTILGISKTAGNFDIKRAYKRLAIKYHPDRNKGNKVFEEKFKEIKEAYEVLSDPKKRSVYDQYGHNAFNQDNSGFASGFSGSGDFGDIFGDVFGDIFGSRKKTSDSKGSDVSYDMELDLEDAVKGISRKIKVSIMQKCSVCYGSGARSGTKRKLCSTCNGSGNLHMRQGFFSVQQTCPNCNGSCYIIDNPCYVCHGSGVERSLKELLVKIPAGINTGDKICLSKEGNCGDFGKFPGNLYIKIKVKKHNIFNREDNNLYCEVPINFSMAALGGKIEIPSLNGKLKLRIPPETQTGRLFRIKNKGVKSVNNDFYGDLLCKVFVETPINLNDYQRKLLYDLGFSLTGNNNGGKNNPKSKSFFDRVKKFLSNLAG